MQYYYILIITVIGCFQFYNILKTRRDMQSAGELLNTYDHKSSIGGIYLIIIFQIIIFYNDVFRERLSIVLWILPIMVILLIAYFRSSRRIMVYERGVLVFGDFIKWDKITSVRLEKNEIELVATKKDTQYFTISQIKNVEKCYNQIVRYTSHLSAHNKPVRETTIIGIEEFLKKE